MKAKYTFMTKQVDSLTELKKKMEEQNRDLQKQLNFERDEKKSLQKRWVISKFISSFAFVRVDVDDGDGNDYDAFIVGRDRDIGDDGKNIADNNVDV